MSEKPFVPDNLDDSACEARWQFSARFLLALVAVAAAFFAGWRLTRSLSEDTGEATVQFLAACLTGLPATSPAWLAWMGRIVRSIHTVIWPIVGGIVIGLFVVAAPALSLVMAFIAPMIMSVWFVVGMSELHRRTSAASTLFAAVGALWWGIVLPIFVAAFSFQIHPIPN